MDFERLNGDIKEMRRRNRSLNVGRARLMAAPHFLAIRRSNGRELRPAALDPAAIDEALAHKCQRHGRVPFSR